MKKKTVWILLDTGDMAWYFPTREKARRVQNGFSLNSSAPKPRGPYKLEVPIFRGPYKLEVPA